MVSHRPLRQALTNLMANAFKYTSKRALPMIEIGCRENDEAEAIFFVRDNGAGFNMTFASKLFQVFQRLHSQAEFPGTGIGLAIVRNVIERHGGRVWAESMRDQGATFYFTIGGTARKPD